MSERIALVLSLIVLCTVVSFIGCGGDDLVFPGMLPLPTATITGTPSCLPSGDACTLSSDCCSGNCFNNGLTLQCE